MVTLEMVRFGPVISAWVVARFNMADCTRQQTGFNRLNAVEASKVATRSASGVAIANIFLVMDECGRADHGIGITEANGASFIEDGRSATEYDFGFEGKTGFSTPSKYYALNLWIH